MHHKRINYFFNNNIICGIINIIKIKLKITTILIFAEMLLWYDCDYLVYVTHYNDSFEYLKYIISAIII